jgi:hypothetical protein
LTVEDRTFMGWHVERMMGLGRLLNSAIEF